MVLGGCCVRCVQRNREDTALEDEFGEQVLLPKQSTSMGAPRTEPQTTDVSSNCTKSTGTKYHKVHAKIFIEEPKRTEEPKIMPQVECNTIRTVRLDVNADDVTAKASQRSMTTSQNISSLTTVCIALLIYFYEGASYNFIFLVRILPARGKEVLVVPFMVLFNLAWGLAVWSYLQTHRADPGKIPQRWRDFALDLGNALPVATARLEWQPGKATWCKKCKIPRPERAHHCNICGMCVLRMDHHCAFIFNCVGFNNHKQFILLLCYSGLACFIALVTSAPELVYCLVTLVSAGHDGTNRLEVSEIIGFLIFGLLALFLTFLVTPLVLAHLMLAARNLTSIEGNYESLQNPYDRGSCTPNFAEVFGSPGLEWLIPLPPARPLGDGMSFMRTDKPEFLPHREGDAGSTADVEARWRQRYRVRPPDTQQDPLDLISSAVKVLSSGCSRNDTMSVSS